MYYTRLKFFFGPRNVKDSFRNLKTNVFNGQDSVKASILDLIGNVNWLILGRSRLIVVATQLSSARFLECAKPIRRQIHVQVSPE